jgi:hypothetical protein
MADCLVACTMCFSGITQDVKAFRCYAWDISDEGLVLGGAGAIVGDPDGTARLWDLAMLPPAPTLPTADFEIDFGLAGAEWTMALAVTPHSNTAQTPKFYGVGSGSLSGWDPCPGWQDPYEFFRGPPVAQLLCHEQPPASALTTCWTVSTRHWACDIARHGVGPIGSYEGPWNPCAWNPCENCAPSLCEFHCYQPMIAGASATGANSALQIFYRIENLSPAAPLPDQKSGLRSSTAVPDDPDAPPVLAGYFFGDASASPDNCLVNGGIWTYGTTDPVRNRLPSTGGLPVLEDCAPLAQRWRAVTCNLTREVVLGWDTRASNQRGVFWTLPCTDGDPAFQLHSARELLATPIEDVDGNTITIEQLYDILPTGEILALVRQSRPPGSPPSSLDYNLYAAVLGLYGDLDGDHVVGAGDLAVLLSVWGPAPNGSAADIDWDLQVNAQDLSVLLSLWESEPKRLLLPASADDTTAYCMMLPGMPCGGKESRFGDPSEELACCMACALSAFGFETTEAFTEWSRTADLGVLACTCEVVKAMIHNQMETEH